MKNIYPGTLLSLGVMICSSSFASFVQYEVSDTTTALNKKQSPIHWRMTARVHSKGMFMYGGRLGTDNPTFDINFTFEYKKWGLLLFKGLDLCEHETDYNFSLVAVYRNFKLSDRITFTPYAGTFLEQENHFADEGSDAACILITAVKLEQHLTFEYTAMFGSLVFQPENLDWVNRYRLTYSQKHLDVVCSLWHNNHVFDDSSYANTALNISYSRVKVAKEIFLSAGVTGLVALQTSDEEENPSTNRIMFTLAAQWVH